VLSNKSALTIVITVYLIVTAGFLIHIPQGSLTYDFGGHVEYTEIISNQKHLPAPYEGKLTQTYHPPLFYLINSLIIPNSIIKGNRTLHINLVQGLSVLYGVLTLCLLFWGLLEVSNRPIDRIIILLFLSTIPGFIMLFSTYNNDSLAAMLSIATIIFSYKLWKQWSRNLAFGLLIIATAGLYTKYTVAPVLISVIIICFLRSILAKTILQKEKLIVGILLLSIIFHLPWLIFHNYRYTNKLFPNNFEMFIVREFQPDSVMKRLKRVVRIPFVQLQSQAWQDPWVHNEGNIATKESDYWVHTWINSVIGSCIFAYPPVNVIWVLLWVHLAIKLISLKAIFKSGLTRTAGMLIVLGHLSQISAMIYALNSPVIVQYRYISWIWLGWAILYSSLLLSQKDKISSLFKKLLIVGIYLNIYVCFTAIGWIS